jgi:hypothetical protein
MIAWLLKKVAGTKPAPRQDNPVRATSPENCALWHDVTRALEAKPKGLAK